VPLLLNAASVRATAQPSPGRHGPPGRRSAQAELRASSPPTPRGAVCEADCRLETERAAFWLVEPVTPPA
jgi:hypothetical protein